ncbi:transcription factor kayak isoform X3 [Drosophila sulfurigaster albostrigata]|uniref:transcription factor kayak isoform X3 n=1 Tax=Drosophila sulfurigaster albostrigata TaxID=89887 RepID=UPI002D21D3FA|nr:transcription factor kayak isoform X3 [Drosophila sulfurigaster albostrigata]
MIALKSIKMQHNSNLQQQQLQLLQQQQQQQQHNLSDNYVVWANNNNTSNNSNNSNNNSGNSNAMQQLQQQQQHRASLWIAESNKQQQQQQQQQCHNNNSMNVNYNQHLLQQQQQQQQQQPQQQYMQQTYANYTQQLTVPTTSPVSSCYYANLQLQQQQQQQQQLQHQAQEQQQFLAPANRHLQQLTQDTRRRQQQCLVSFDGMQSVPTLTTPTLTPTTLRTIEETIFELTSEPQNVPFQAGFKPPPLTTPVNSSSGGSNTGTPTSSVSISTLANVINANPIVSQQQQQQFDMSMNCGSMPGSDSEDSNGSWNDGQLNDDQSTTDTSSAATDSTSYQNGGMLGNNSNGVANNFTAALAAVNSVGRNNSNAGQAGSSNNSNTSTSATPARRGGGRRPNKAANMSPEEEEKRRIRRERNKLAAARCRKRRVDQTNELSEEVEALQKKGETLKKEIEKLNATKNQLEYVIHSHRPTCQKVRDDLLSVATCNGLIAPTASLLSAGAGGSCSGSSLHNNSNSNDSSSGTITGFDATLNSTGRSNSPLDLKPVLTNEQLLQHIKHEPQDGALESGSSLDQDGPTPAKRFALPNIATLNASLTTPTGPAGGSLNTPMGAAPPGSFSAFAGSICNMSSPTLNALNKLPKARPNTLNVQRPFGAHMAQAAAAAFGDGKAPMQIQGVPIQTPSTGTFNFDSLMDGGTGLTPVSGPLVPTCSSQNKHPLELPTPTSEPSKLVSL